jgi:hypothetical protein
MRASSLESELKPRSLQASHDLPIPEASEPAHQVLTISRWSNEYWAGGKRRLSASPPCISINFLAASRAIDRFLDGSPLSDQTMHVIGSGQVDAFRQFLDMEGHDSFHGLSCQGLREFRRAARHEVQDLRGIVGE